MASNKIVVPSTVRALRILTLALLAASLAVIATDKFDFPAGDLSDFIGVPPQKVTFKDVHAYRYVLAIAVVGCAYTLLQIPFSILSIASRKRVIGGSVDVAIFLICVDVVFALAIATGAAAGYGFTTDVKRSVDFTFNRIKDAGTLDFIKLNSGMDRFFKLAYVSAGLMLLAAICMAFMIMISVYTLAR